MSSPSKKTQKNSTQSSPSRNSMSLDEYEEKKKRQLQKLKKREMEDKRLFKEMTRPVEQEVLTKSRDLNQKNPLATNGSEKYQQARKRLLPKYIMK